MKSPPTGAAGAGERRFGARSPYIRSRSGRKVFSTTLTIAPQVALSNVNIFWNGSGGSLHTSCQSNTAVAVEAAETAIGDGPHRNVALKHRMKSSELES